MINFHTFGIPLSSGLILEYYYNNLFLEVPINEIALVFGIQWIGLFAMEWLVVKTFRWKHWRWASVSVTIILILSRAVVARGSRPWMLLLGMHALEGLCLGFLRSTSLRCLASHYNDDVAAVSMQSGAAAMLGGLFYSFVAWIFLRTDNYQGMVWANFYIVLFALSPALAGFFQASKLDNEVKKLKRTRSIPRIRHQRSTSAIQSEAENQAMQENFKYDGLGTYLLLGGYFLIVTFVLVWPTLFPLLFASRPIYEYPEYAAYWSFSMFATATFTAVIFARPWPHRGLGVVNIFTSAGIFAGCLIIIAAWTPNFWMWGIVSVLYGLCLGPLLTLHMKVFNLLCRYWTKARYLSAGLGVFVFGGVGVAGVMVQGYENGPVVLTVPGGVMVVGGFCMAMGKWLKYPVRYVVI